MDIKEIYSIIKEFSKPDLKKVGIQILNTFVLYILSMTVLLYLGNKGNTLFILIPLSLITGSLVVRLFILFHDCTHNSFVKTKKWNSILGSIFSIFVFTPFFAWQKEHSIHHGTVGNLDARGVGDIWTLTVEEYNKSSKFKKITYLIFRHPLFLFIIAPVMLFSVLNRVPKLRSTRKEMLSYAITNIGIVMVGFIYSSIFSFEIYIIYQMIVLGIASTIGVWLFYIQHQFEGVYWEEKNSWKVVDAALKGSTFYKLPLVLEWISGCIGYHNIHHLNSKIPNYNLKACYKKIGDIKDSKIVTLSEGFKYAFYQFYDVDSKKLITYRELKKIS